MAAAACCNRSMGTMQVKDCTLMPTSTCSLSTSSPLIKCKTLHFRLEVVYTSSHISNSIGLYWLSHNLNYRWGQGLRFFKGCHSASNKIPTPHCGLWGLPWSGSCPTQQPHLVPQFLILWPYGPPFSFLKCTDLPSPIPNYLLGDWPRKSHMYTRHEQPCPTK